jgi:hypothetical protein
MSLRYVYGQDKLVADFVIRLKLAIGAPGVDFDLNKIRTVGIIDANNELIAGLIFYNFSPETGWIELSLEALPKSRWLTRTTLAVMFQYPFLQCGSQMLVTKTSMKHQHVLRMLAALNFTFITIPRLYGRNRDGVLCMLSDDAWKASKTCRRFKHHLLPPTAAVEDDRKVA